MQNRTAIYWLKITTKYLFAFLYVLAGVMHFVRPEMYMKIMPPYLPWHGPLVLLSGVADIVRGVALAIPQTSSLAGWGLIALLIAIFPANIYLYQHQEILGGPPLAHLLRLPLQAVLILFAYWYTRPDAPRPTGDSASS